MNREFMSEYFDRVYEDLMTTRDGRDNPAYQAACQRVSEAEKELMNLCGGMDTALWNAYEECIDAKAAEYDLLLRAVYLAGVEDVEKMLH